ncbi:MAG: hypothetical protein IKW24_02120 [Clostridia bacterium]|nr:hypothetical protein [Clostridia bacterium]
MAKETLMMKKSAEISADFSFLRGFSAALELSGVPLYVNDSPITPSASK